MLVSASVVVEEVSEIANDADGNHVVADDLHLHVEASALAVVDCEATRTYDGVAGSVSVNANDENAKKEQRYSMTVVALQQQQQQQDVRNSTWPAPSAAA